MTLTLAAIERERILVATDTAVFDVDDAFYGFMPKVYAIPGVDALVTGRGPLRAVQDFAVALMSTPLRSFDHVPDLAPDLAAQVFSGVRAEMVQAGMEVRDYDGGDLTGADLGAVLEVQVFGFNTAERQAQAWGFNSYDGFEPTPMSPPGVMASPQPPEGVPSVPQPASDRAIMAGMKELFHFTSQWSRREALGAEHCGGYVIGAEATRDGVTIRRLGTLPNYERLCAEAGIEPEHAPTAGKVVDIQRRRGAKVGRNDPCPCGSGQKAKKCCGA